MTVLISIYSIVAILIIAGMLFLVFAKNNLIKNMGMLDKALYLCLGGVLILAMAVHLNWMLLPWYIQNFDAFSGYSMVILMTFALLYIIFLTGAILTKSTYQAQAKVNKYPKKIKI